jgi:hypothetical protein
MRLRVPDNSFFIRASLVLLASLCISLQMSACSRRSVQNKQQSLAAPSLYSLPVKLEEPVAESESVKPVVKKETVSGKEKFVSCKLIDETGISVKPSSVVTIGNDLYFLGPAQLWCARDGVALLEEHKSPSLVCTELGLNEHKINDIPVQEFCDLVCFVPHKTLIVLEKSGDLLEFNPASKTWRVAWPNKPITYSPDPDFISLTCSQNVIVLLDPERNELWKFDGRNLSRLITPEVLPWKALSSKSVADGFAICQDGNIAVMKQSGTVTEYGGRACVTAIRQLNCKKFGWLKATRICNGPTDFLIVDREHNAIVELNKQTSTTRVHYFPSDWDLRGICNIANGFAAVNGDRIVYLPLSIKDDTAKSSDTYASRTLDPRLQKLRLPILHSRLPYHPGVWPGARRLYRYGVHKGVDFFYDTGCGVVVKTGTPVLAAADGRIIRIDSNFKDMGEKQFAKIMRECINAHNTSDSNEDKFRGCQVWIDHGNGLRTKYAHLDHVNYKLHAGEWVKCGSVIGYVGVSGTGENLPGHVKQPHLHFEVWLDGNYLGYGLTPAETIAVYQRIFGCGCKNS